MRDKYGPLRDYLKLCDKSSIKLTYKEIEEIIGTELPSSAYVYKEWWSNRKPYVSQAKAYLDAGYYVENHNLIEQWVIFSKLD